MRTCILQGLWKLHVALKEAPKKSVQIYMYFGWWVETQSSKQISCLADTNSMIIFCVIKIYFYVTDLTQCPFFLTKPVCFDVWFWWSSRQGTSLQEATYLCHFSVISTTVYIILICLYNLYILFSRFHLERAFIPFPIYNILS